MSYFLESIFLKEKKLLDFFEKYMTERKLADGTKITYSSSLARFLTFSEEKNSLFFADNCLNMGDGLDTMLIPSFSSFAESDQFQPSTKFHAVNAYKMLIEGLKNHLKNKFFPIHTKQNIQDQSGGMCEPTFTMQNALSFLICYFQ